ncbi:MAG: hypothetical protein ACREM3_21500 [Candidatus Rokuibacteriota bacterium]
MKQWSMVTGLVVGLSLLSWLLIYRVEGTPPGHGLTVMLVGVWLAVVAVVRRLRG